MLRSGRLVFADWFGETNEFSPKQGWISTRWISCTKIKCLLPRLIQPIHSLNKSLRWTISIFFGGGFCSWVFPGARHTTARSSFTVTRSVTSVLVFVHGYNCPIVLLLQLASPFVSKTILFGRYLHYYVQYISTHTTLIPWMMQHRIFSLFMLPVASICAEDWACMRLGQLMTLGHLVLLGWKAWRASLLNVIFEVTGTWVIGLPYCGRSNNVNLWQV